MMKLQLLVGVMMVVAQTLIRGQDIAPLRNDANAAAALVTFNGIRFDTRFLKKAYPDLELPALHLDLMYLCRRFGLKGGQKAIERSLGIDVRETVAEIDGAGAVLLWHQYLGGDIGALQRLIHYNRADIAAMGAIMDQVMGRLGDQIDLFQGNVRFRKWSAPQDWMRLPHLSLDSTPIREKRAKFHALFESEMMSRYRIIGIDLTGSEKRKSGWCMLSGNHAVVAEVKTDHELLGLTMLAKPHLVSIDSPLCLPAGRKTVGDEDPGRDRYGIMRECERELKRRGVNVYPCLIKSMQRLTDRGIRLASYLRDRGIPVIESYPGAAQDIMRIPRKGAGTKWLREGLMEFGIEGDYLVEEPSHDELDAITSALVGTFHLSDMSEALGTDEEAPLIIPRMALSSVPTVVGISGPIAAGKTTLARALAQHGYAYTRYSSVIDDLLRERKSTLNRQSRQSLGEELNASGRQRLLSERVVKRAGEAGQIVVDGLRFPDDHAYFVERFGVHFSHVHVFAEESIRAQRYERMQENFTFREAVGSKVENRIGEMHKLARFHFDNEGEEEDVKEFALMLSKRLHREARCQYR